MRKVYAKATVEVILMIDEDAPTNEILDEMRFALETEDSRAEVLDTEWSNWEITDSK